MTDHLSAQTEERLAALADGWAERQGLPLDTVQRELLIDYGRQILRTLLMNPKADGFPVEDC